MVVIPRTCRAVRESGAPCRAAPLRDGEYCLMHSPEHAAEMAEARRLGGQRRRREVTLSGVYDLEELDNVPALRRVLTIAATDALSLENTVPRLRVLIAIVQVAANLLTVGEHEERLRALETTLHLRIERNRVEQQGADWRPP